MSTTAKVFEMPSGAFETYVMSTADGPLISITRPGVVPACVNVYGPPSVRVMLGMTGAAKRKRRHASRRASSWVRYFAAGMADGEGDVRFAGWLTGE